MELVTFDLNGTLLLGSIFRYTAQHLGRGDRVEETTRLEKSGEISKEEAYRRNHALFVDEATEDIGKLLSKAPWIDAIEHVVDELRARGLQVWIVTDQPDWALQPLSRWGLKEGVYTRTHTDGARIGEIETLLLAKWPPLEAKLEDEGIDPSEVCHVGDWENDLPIFENVGSSIALNPALDEVRDAADRVVRGDSLQPVLDAIDHG